MSAFDDIRPQRRPVLFLAAGITAVLLLGTGAWWFSSGDQTPPPRRIVPSVVVQLVPPPPPPPPPPPQEKPPEPEMVEQSKMVEPEVKEEPIVDKPPEAAEHDDAPPPGPLALDAKAEGPGDAMGLGSNPGGRGLMSGAGRSRWGWYAAIVQSQIEAALRNNGKLRNSLMQVQLRLWADSSGRISRVQIVSSNGTPELNAILQNDLLPGLQLREAPPGDMPMPMVTRITVRRTS